MADFKIPNLCGASPEFNSILSKFETTMNSAISGLEVDASALKATLDTDVTALVSDVKAMIPELPKLPEVNLQAQLTSLTGLIPGGPQHKALLSDITTKFGSGLTASGLSLDTLVSDAKSAITGGTSLCSAIPNFTVPAAGGDAVEKAVGVLQAAVDSEKEEPSDWFENANFVAEKTALESRVALMQFEGESTDVDVVKGTVTSQTPPTTDIAAFTVATESKEVTFDGGEMPTKVKVTTPEQQSGKNIAPKGSVLVKRKVYITEYIKEADVKGATSGTEAHTFAPFAKGFTLSRTPVSISNIKGYVPDPNNAFRPRPKYLGIYTSKTTSPEGYGEDEFGLPTFKDAYKVIGNQVEVTEHAYNYVAHTGLNSRGKKLNHRRYKRRFGTVFVVTYAYMDIYDPNFIDTDEA